MGCWSKTQFHPIFVFGGFYLNESHRLQFTPTTIQFSSTDQPPIDFQSFASFDPQPSRSPHLRDCSRRSRQFVILRLRPSSIFSSFAGRDFVGLRRWSAVTSGFLVSFEFCWIESRRWCDFVVWKLYSVYRSDSQFFFRFLLLLVVNGFGLAKLIKFQCV